MVLFLKNFKYRKNSLNFFFKFGYIAAKASQNICVSIGTLNTYTTDRYNIILFLGKNLS